MNVRPQTSKNSLEARCLEALRSIEKCSHELTQDEQALYDRICNVDDPLSWELDGEDFARAEALWNKMSVVENQSIQIAAISSSIRSLKAVATYPVGGFI